MSYAGNQNPWAPYDSYKDCSLGICSVYCPQWCFYILPPPPPDDPSDDDSGPTFSPLIIAIIGILASAFLLVTYYTVITKYCRRRDGNSSADVEANLDQTRQDQWQAAPSGLDEIVIKSITVCKYKKGEGLVEGTECSVCLSEFQDDENLRLLPKCSHAFHLPCIDTWLKSHSNCPLCRANVASSNPPLPPMPPPPHSLQNNSALSPSALTVDAQTDLVLVVDDRDEIHRDEGAASLCDATPKGSCNGENSEVGNNENGDEEDGVKHFRRSISLGTFFIQHRLSVSDVLRIEEDDDQELPTEGSKCSSSRSYGAIGRSISTGRIMFSSYDKGNNSTILF